MVLTSRFDPVYPSVAGKEINMTNSPTPPLDPNLDGPRKSRSGNEGQSGTRRRAPGGRPFAIVERLVTFLDSHFAELSPTVQNTIGVVFAALIAILLLQAFLTPTYVAGQLYTIKDGKAVQASSDYQISYKGSRTLVDQYGNWMVTALPRVIPGWMNITVKKNSSGGRIICDFPVWAPLAGVRAIFDREYRVIVDEGKPLDTCSDVKSISRLDEAGRALAELPRNLLAPYAEAQVVAPTPSESTRTLKADATLLLSLDGITVAPSKSIWNPFRGNPRVYFAIYHEGQRIRDRELILGRGAQVQYRWPVQTIPQSWLPVIPGQHLSMGGIEANVTALRKDPQKPAPESRLPYIAGRIVIEMRRGDDDEMLGTFTVPVPLPAKPDRLRSHENISTSIEISFRWSDR